MSASRNGRLWREALGGDEVSVFSATHGRQDAHYARARPSLIARVRRADLLICTGGGLEAGWLPVLMQRGAPRGVQAGQPGHVIAADYVELMDKPQVIDRSHGDVHPEGNPHLHLDPDNIRVVASVVAERLQRLDPDNSDAYGRRLASFLQRWDEAVAGWRQRATVLDGMAVVVYHVAWRYLMSWTGMTEAAALEPLPGMPPTPNHLRDVLEAVRGGSVAAIIRTPYAPTDASNWLSERTGLPVVELPFTVGGQDGVDDLFTLFEVTLDLLEDVRD